MGHMVLYVQPSREQVDSNGRATHAQNVYYPKKLNYRQNACMLYVAPLSDVNVFKESTKVKKATVVLSDWEV